MDLGVEGKVAIITGGSDGIGRAAAEYLSREGALVAIASRTQADLDRVSSEISALSGNEVFGIATDVREEETVRKLIETVIQKWGRIDILVNNAGTSSASRFEEMTDAQIDEDFSLKVRGAIYCARHALPHLKKTKGCICNTTTPGGKVPGSASQPTALSRAAGISLTKTWANEFAGDGIRVNTICVGFLKSGQHKKHMVAARSKNPDLTQDSYYERLASLVPMGRVGEASEAGDVIAFLCSSIASYITGTAINVDGGQSPVV